MSEEGQDILEMLHNANQRNEQWPKQQSDPMTASLLASMNTQMQQMQNQQMQMLQAQLSQQQYLRAYSMAMPGVPSPNQIYSDPTISNYALQNMYTMNPYMANFFGQSQGNAGMNMAPASYMTSPRMGIFRGSRYDLQGRPITSHGLFADIGALNYRDPSAGALSYMATLGMRRTFGPGEDPTDEIIEARRRQFKRGESAYGAAIAAAEIGLPFLLGGVAGAAIGLAGLPALGMVGNAYFERRAETSQIYDMSRKIATGANAMGFRQQGFSLSESARLMGGMRRDAAANPMYNMNDMMQILEQSTQAGMFSYTGDSRQMESQLKNIVKSLDTFMRMAGDPDVKEAIQRMGTLQTMGVSQPDMIRAMTGLKAMANLAGTSVNSLMSTSGAYGAQMAAQMGVGPFFGMTAGGLGQGMARSMAQRGYMTPTEMALRGGEEGVTQSLTQMLVNTIGTSVEQRWSAIRTGNKNATLADAYNSLSSMSMEQLFEHAREAKDQASEFMNKMTPADQITAFRRQMREEQRYSGLDMQTYLHSRFGEQWKQGAYLMSNQAMDDTQARMADAMRTEAMSKREKRMSYNNWLNRAFMGVAGAWNSTISGFNFEGIAESEQIKAMGAAGYYVPQGLTEGTYASRAELDLFGNIDLNKSSKTMSYDDLRGNKRLFALAETAADSLFSSRSAAGEGRYSISDRTARRWDVGGIPGRNYLDRSEQDRATVIESMNSASQSLENALRTSVTSEGRKITKSTSEADSLALLESVFTNGRLDTEKINRLSPEDSIRLAHRVNALASNEGDIGSKYSGMVDQFNTLTGASLFSSGKNAEALLREVGDKAQKSLNALSPGAGGGLSFMELKTDSFNSKRMTDTSLLANGGLVGKLLVKTQAALKKTNPNISEKALADAAEMVIRNDTLGLNALGVKVDFESMPSRVGEYSAAYNLMAAAPRGKVAIAAADVLEQDRTKAKLSGEYAKTLYSRTDLEVSADTIRQFQEASDNFGDEKKFSTKQIEARIKGARQSVNEAESVGQLAMGKSPSELLGQSNHHLMKIEQAIIGLARQEGVAV